MFRNGFVTFGICLGLTASTVSAAGSLDPRARPSIAATQKRVQGIITAVDRFNVTIAPLRTERSVSGRIDPARTKVFIDGKPATLAALRVTHSAKADLGLDDVWSYILVDSAK